MSRREDIDNAIWSDSDFVDLTADAKLLYLWSFTNPSCGMSGLYKAPIGLAAYQTGLTPKRIEKAIGELAGRDFLYWIDGVVWVRSRVKHLRTRTSQIARSVELDVSKIAEGHPLRIRFLDRYAADPWLRKNLSGMRNELNLKRTSTEGQVKVA